MSVHAVYALRLPGSIFVHRKFRQQMTRSRTEKQSPTESDVIRLLSETVDTSLLLSVLCAHNSIFHHLTLSVPAPYFPVPDLYAPD